MKALFLFLPLLLMGASAVAQTKSAPPTSASIVAVIESVTSKNFEPDTAYAALTDEDETLLAKEPVANWSLPQESGNNITYYNLVVGTRSYQLLVVKSPKVTLPTATLLRFATPKSKPEPIARGTLKPKEEKPK
ncbi:hypothetical protein ACFSUS_10160 [Spirosoma soli]|uniref:Uncharacterized protein n=1 Tax=Spirosoma soli TaxID=1770529 RepID=A0ABW5M1S7_9BACT